MKKQVFGMIAALIALTVMLLTGAYAAEAPANAERAARDADAETETAELSAENIAYAILYEDGTLVFQTSETPETGRAVKATYEVDLTAAYGSSVPWYNERESIRVADFAEKISPTSTVYWFRGCSNLERVDNISNLDTANVTNMDSMFDGCSALTALDVSHFDTANVKVMSNMFALCSGLTALDVSHFNTANVKVMSSMFINCSGLTALDVSHFNTANVEDISDMFCGCSGLMALDVSHFDTANIMYGMSQMFFNCSGLKALDVSHFNTANVTDMSDMFFGCSGLTTLDVSQFDTTNVTDMHGMFYDCSNLKALDVSHFNTANVTNMENMFGGCSGLTALNLSHFDTAKVTDMSYMFYDCNGLTVLDLSQFDTANVKYMGNMFYGCSDLKTIYASGKFTTVSISYSYEMFFDCKSLVGGNGTKYDDYYISEEYARIDTADEKGYFTYKAAPAPVKYAIADAVIKDGTLSVTLTNPDAATVAVPYFDANGKFISLQSQDVPANAGTVTLALSADAKKFCVMLVDTDWRPLCRFAANIQ